MNLKIKINIIILNYNCFNDTINCIQEIIKNDFINYQIFAVDNNSQNDSFQKITNWMSANIINNSSKKHLYTYKTSDSFYESKALSSINSDIRIRDSKQSYYLKYPVTIVKNVINNGFAAGNNIIIRQLLRESPDDYILILNPDILIERNALSSQIKFITNHHTVYGFYIYCNTDRSKLLCKGGGKVNWYGTSKLVIDNSKLDFIRGGSFLTHIKNFNRIGLLPECYFLYWEETDWCFRFLKSGGSLIANKNAICYNTNGQSINRSSLRARLLYHYGTFLFYKRNTPLLLIFVIIIMLHIHTINKFKDIYSKFKK